MKKGFSQEGLKLIACLTMLIDHVAYEIIYPVYAGLSAVSAVDPPAVKLIYQMYLLCRSIGRISFPIFAFLLVEGIHHTHDPKKYAKRLAIGALLAEIPYNLMVADRIDWGKQSVMATLLLGFLAVYYMGKTTSLAWKSVIILPFALLADMFRVEYGWAGVVLIALFELSRYSYSPNLMRTVGMIVLFHYTSGFVFQIGNFSLPRQVLGVLSMIFIANYDGRKLTRSKWVQWAFYLFYPVHLLLIWGLGKLVPRVLTIGVSIVL